MYGEFFIRREKKFNNTGPDLGVGEELLDLFGRPSPKEAAPPNNSLAQPLLDGFDAENSGQQLYPGTYCC